MIGVFRITKQGFLEIKRGSLFKTMICPKNNNMMPCNDSCPLFGEPVEHSLTHIKLELCENKTLYCKKAEFKDERR